MRSPSRLEVESGFWSDGYPFQKSKHCASSSLVGITIELLPNSFFPRIPDLVVPFQKGKGWGSKASGPDDRQC